MSSTEGCGKKGVECPFKDIPVCDPPSPNEGWAGLHRLMLSTSEEGVNLKIIPKGEEVASEYQNPSADNVEGLIREGSCCC